VNEEIYSMIFQCSLFFIHVAGSFEQICIHYDVFSFGQQGLLQDEWILFLIQGFSSQKIGEKQELVLECFST